MLCIIIITRIIIREFNVSRRREPFRNNNENPLAPPPVLYKFKS